MNIKKALQMANIKLNEKNISEPIIKSRILLSDILKVRKEDLIIKEQTELTECEEKIFFASIEKLCDNIPLQYITGKQEFMGNTFIVNENVLIPRQDTEVLVEETIKNAESSILELCTGSGIIAISIAKMCINTQITATDISEKALEVAKENARKLGVNIRFIQSDLFKNVHGKYDLIVSNPPYIETETIQKLEMQVQKEPFIALNGGKDGLHFYREIVKDAYKYLNKNGKLCLEIGYNQKNNVIQILKEKYSEIRCIKDLSGNDRVIICKWKG